MLKLEYSSVKGELLQGFVSSSSRLSRLLCLSPLIGEVTLVCQQKSSDVSMGKEEGGCSLGQYPEWWGSMELYLSPRRAANLLEEVPTRPFCATFSFHSSPPFLSLADLPLQSWSAGNPMGPEPGERRPTVMNHFNMCAYGRGTGQGGRVWRGSEASGHSGEAGVKREPDSGSPEKGRLHKAQWWRAEFKGILQRRAGPSPQ